MKKFIVLLSVFCSFPIAGGRGAERTCKAEASAQFRNLYRSCHDHCGHDLFRSFISAAPVVKPFVMTDNKGHDEKYWRERFDKARADLKSAEDRVQLLDNKVKGLNTAFLTRSDVYNKENTLGPEISDGQKQLEDARNQVEQAKQKISDLKDELHRAGGPAGWAR